MEQTVSKTNTPRWIKKTLRLILLLLGVSAAAFALVSLSPIDPLQTNVGQAALGSMSAEQVETLRRYYGVDVPAAQRFLNWATGILHGDFGTSLIYRRPVLAVMGEKLAYSLGLMAFAWVISGVVGFALGVISGTKKGGIADRVITGGALVISGTPAFWLALVFLTVFAVKLGWFPVGLAVPIGVTADQVSLGSRIACGVLPALTLSVTGMSNVILHTREKTAQVMESDYVLFARARGEKTGSIVLRHGLRNVILPAMTLQFCSISEILGGSVLVEQVFSYPGLGQAAVTAGLGGDVPLLLGITVISAILVFGGNLAADLLYGAVDPRMRKRGERR